MCIFIFQLCTPLSLNASQGRNHYHHTTNLRIKPNSLIHGAFVTRRGDPKYSYVSISPWFMAIESKCHLTFAENMMFNSSQITYEIWGQCNSERNGNPHQHQLCFLLVDLFAKGNLAKKFELCFRNIDDLISFIKPNNHALLLIVFCLFVV